MDPRRLESLAKLVGSGQSRRRVLRTLAGGAFASLSAAIGLDRVDAAKLRSVGNSCKFNADCASNLCVQEAPGRKICHCGSATDCPNSDLCHPSVCSAGACVAGAPVVCPNPDQCHTQGTCDPTTGQCSNPNKPDGTVCDDGNAATCNDVCTNGTCAGAAVNLNTDNSNCGSCGNICSGTGVTCGGGGAPGVCGCTPDNTSLCADHCGTHTNNCGQSVACPACVCNPTCDANHVCTNGACLLAYPHCSVCFGISVEHVNLCLPSCGDANCSNPSCSASTDCAIGEWCLFVGSCQTYHCAAGVTPS